MLSDVYLNNMNFCRCGCGQMIEMVNARGKLKKYVKGHNVVNFIKHGSDHPSWKGGKSHDKDGYVIIWYPNHPRNLCGNYVHEHVLIMEEKLGRYLTDIEVVHHINEIKTDNRIENLKLMTEKEHRSYHASKMWKEGKYHSRDK